LGPGQHLGQQSTELKTNAIYLAGMVRQDKYRPALRRHRVLEMPPPLAERGDGGTFCEEFGRKVGRSRGAAGKLSEIHHPQD
jgi:hypothetical protein